MASHAELFGLINNPIVTDHVQMAIAEVAYNIITLVPADTALRLAWAKEAIGNPASLSSSIVPFVLIANKGSSVAQILAAPDSAFITNVNTAVNALVGPAA